MTLFLFLDPELPDTLEHYLAPVVMASMICNSTTHTIMETGAVLDPHRSPLSEACSRLSGCAQKGVFFAWPLLCQFHFSLGIG